MNEQEQQAQAQAQFNQDAHDLKEALLAKVAAFEAKYPGMTVGLVKKPGAPIEMAVKPNTQMSYTVKAGVTRPLAAKKS